MKKARISTLKVGAKVQFKNGTQGEVTKNLEHCVQVGTEKGNVVATFKSKHTDISSFVHGRMFIVEEGKGKVSEDSYLDIEVEIRNYEEGWGIAGSVENLFKRFKDLRSWYGLSKIKLVEKEGVHGIYKAVATQNI